MRTCAFPALAAVGGSFQLRGFFFSGLSFRDRRTCARVPLVPRTSVIG